MVIYVGLRVPDNGKSGGTEKVSEPGGQITNEHTSRRQEESTRDGLMTGARSFHVYMIVSLVLILPYTVHATKGGDHVCLCPSHHLQLPAQCLAQNRYLIKTS